MENCQDSETPGEQDPLGTAAEEEEEQQDSKEEQLLPSQDEFEGEEVFAEEASSIAVEEEEEGYGEEEDRQVEDLDFVSLEPSLHYRCLRCSATYSEMRNFKPHCVSKHGDDPVGFEQRYVFLPEKLFLFSVMFFSLLQIGRVPGLDKLPYLRRPEAQDSQGPVQPLQDDPQDHSGGVPRRVRGIRVGAGRRRSGGLLRCGLRPLPNVSGASC